MQKTAVVHLVRKQNGLEPLQHFLDSYRTHESGLPHDLIFILKGFSGVDDLGEYRQILADFPHKQFFVDDWGYDIRPYFETVRQFNYDHYCFFNSFSRILAPNWLALLYGWAGRKDVGMAGATGSYESFATNNRIRKKMLSTMSISGRIGWRIRHVANAPTLGEGVVRAGAWVLEEARIWDPVYFFPLFPNYHIRTNAFMASRDILLRLKVLPVISKVSAYLIESGRNSLTNQVLSAGLKAILVGRDGQGFEPESWHRSNIFRQGRQENLLVSDNQTVAYDRADKTQREEFAYLAWGEHARAT